MSSEDMGIMSYEEGVTLGWSTQNKLESEEKAEKDDRLGRLDR